MENREIFGRISLDILHVDDLFLINKELQVSVFNLCMRKFVTCTYVIKLKDLFIIIIMLEYLDFIVSFDVQVDLKPQWSKDILLVQTLQYL